MPITIGPGLQPAGCYLLIQKPVNLRLSLRYAAQRPHRQGLQHGGNPHAKNVYTSNLHPDFPIGGHHHDRRLLRQTGTRTSATTACSRTCARANTGTSTHARATRIRRRARASSNTGTRRARYIRQRWPHGR